MTSNAKQTDHVNQKNNNANNQLELVKNLYLLLKSSLLLSSANFSLLNEG